MMTTNEILFNGPEVFASFCVIFCFFRLELFPDAMRFSAEILSPYGGFPSQSGFLEFVVSPWQYCWTICHRKYKFFNFLVSSGLLSHSVFWDKFLMHPTFPVLQSQQSEYLLHQFLPRTTHVQERFLVIPFFPNWWIIALSLSEFGRYSTSASNGIIGPLNDSPNLRSCWYFPFARRSWTFRR